MPTAKWCDLKNWCTMRLDSSFEQFQICGARSCQRLQAKHLHQQEAARQGSDLCKFVHLVVADVEFQAILLVRKLVQAVQEATKYCVATHH